MVFLFVFFTPYCTFLAKIICKYIIFLFILWQNIYFLICEKWLILVYLRCYPSLRNSYNIFMDDFLEVSRKYLKMSLVLFSFQYLYILFLFLFYYVVWNFQWVEKNNDDVKYPSVIPLFSWKAYQNDITCCLQNIYLPVGKVSFWSQFTTHICN